MSLSSSQSTATAFRSLTWSGSVPLQISLSSSAASGAGESYFVRPFYPFLSSEASGLLVIPSFIARKADL